MAASPFLGEERDRAVELEEGVRVVSGLREVAFSELRLDLPLEVAFQSLSETITVPVFTPRR